jgi:hypothetical protein
MQKYITNYFGTPLIIGIRTKLYSNEILFFEGEVNYARIHFRSGKQRVIARTLLYIQNKINTENFIRINRKYLVNRKFIVEVGEDLWCFRIRRFCRFRGGGSGRFWMGEVKFYSKPP